MYLKENKKKNGAKNEQDIFDGQIINGIKQARIIVDEYIIVSAPLQINIKSKQRKRIISHLSYLEYRHNIQPTRRRTNSLNMNPRRIRSNSIQPEEALTRMASGIILESLFVDAQEEIFTLMSRDSFTRYKASKFYNDLVLQINSDSLQRKQPPLPLGNLTSTIYSKQLPTSNILVEKKLSKTNSECFDSHTYTKKRSKSINTTLSTLSTPLLPTN